MDTKVEYKPDTYFLGDRPALIPSEIKSATHSEFFLSFQSSCNDFTGTKSDSPVTEESVQYSQNTLPTTATGSVIELDINAPGHVNNLTRDQLVLLFKLWDKVLQKIDDEGDFVSGLPRPGFLSEVLSLDEKGDCKELLDPCIGFSGTDQLNRHLFKLLNVNKKEQQSQSSLGSFSSLPLEIESADLKDKTESLTVRSQSAMDQRMGSEPFIPTTTFAEEIWRGFLLGGNDVDSQLLSFLRARKWNFQASLEMLLTTFDWRTKMGLFSLVMHGESAIKPSLLKNGMCFFHGNDKLGHLIIYVLVRKHNKSAQSLEECEKLTLYSMEMARKLHLPGMESVTLVFDMSDLSYSAMDFPASRFFLRCFQSHYPESLHKCFIVNAPWIFGAFWKMIRSLLDPVVSEKVMFVSKDALIEYIDEDVLLSEFGGENAFTYEYESFTEFEDKDLLYLVEEAEDESSEAIQKVRIDFVKTKNEFVSVTRKVLVCLEKAETTKEEGDQDHSLAALLAERCQLKSQLRHLSTLLNRWTIPKSYYHRIGAINAADCTVDWSRADP